MQVITRTFFMVILLGFISAAQAQKTKKHSLEKVVQQIAAYNVYESAHVGFAGVKSTQYTRFEKLLALATEHQLIELATLDTNAVVRLYALQALHHKGVAIANSLQKQFAQDTAHVQTLNGCIGGTLNVGLLASTILRQPYPASNALTPKEKTEQLRSKLQLYFPRHFLSLRYVVNNIRTRNKS